MNYTNLSKTISYALRHHPEEFDLVLDNEGYVFIEDLLNAIHCTRDDLDYIVYVLQEQEGAKKRFEVNNEMIRACYGHSTTMVDIEYQESIPPKILYHGTLASTYDNFIKYDGIKSMNRQYICLSEDSDTAFRVAHRHNRGGKDLEVCLWIDTEEARKDGVKFYCGNDTTWLCKYIDPKYIKVREAKLDA